MSKFSGKNVDRVQYASTMLWNILTIWAAAFNQRNMCICLANLMHSLCLQTGTLFNLNRGQPFLAKKKYGKQKFGEKSNLASRNPKPISSPSINY